MADNIQNIRISGIDAPFPEQWREEMYSFVKEIEGIKESLNVISLNTESSNRTLKSLSDFYESGGGLSAQASQAVAPHPDPFVPYSGSGVSEGASRQRLSHYVPTDEEEAAAMGLSDSTVHGSGASSTASLPPDATPAEQLGSRLPDPLSIPRAGHFTIQNVFDTLGRAISQRGISQAGDSGENNWQMQAGNALLNVGDKVLPYGALAQHYVGQGIDMSRASANLGFQMGYTNTGSGVSVLGQNLSGNINVGPLSFRSPLNSLALGGASQAAQSALDALTHAGLTSQQAMNIRSGFTNLGWYPGQTRFNQGLDMFKAGVTGQYSELWKQPYTQQLWDESTRQGADPKDFAANINLMTSAAKSAHMGLEDMANAMQEWGQQIHQQGGTTMQGQTSVVQGTNATGLNAANLNGLVNSPWSQSAVYRATGLPPWMQGSLNIGTRIGASLQGFGQAMASVGRPSSTQPQPIAGYPGFSDQVSGIEQQAAQLHQFMYPDLSPDLIQKMIRRPALVQQMQAGAGATGAMSSWQEMVSVAKQKGNQGTLNALMNATPGGTQGSWGNLLHDLHNARNPQTGKLLLNADQFNQVKQAGSNVSDPIKKAKARQAALEKAVGGNAASAQNKVMITLSPQAQRLFRLNGSNGQRNKKAVGAGVPSQTINNPPGAPDGVDPLSSGVLGDATAGVNDAQSFFSQLSSGNNNSGG